MTTALRLPVAHVPATAASVSPAPTTAVGRRVAMLVANDVRHDSRVRREAASLAAAGYEVTVYGVLTEATRSVPVQEIDGFRLVRLPMLTASTVGFLSAAAGRPWRSPRSVFLAAVAAAFIRTRPFMGGTLHFAANWRWRWRRWGARVAEVASPADVWHAHDLTALPAALTCARRLGGRVVYDSHEIFSEAGATARKPLLARRALARHEARLVRECDALITVNHSVAGILAGMLSPRRISVIYNCAEALPTPQRDPRLRDRLGLREEVPLLIYHGSIVSHRGVIEAASALLEEPLRDAHLAVMGYGPLRPSLMAFAASVGLGNRVHFLPPVLPHEVVAWVSGADVAVMPIQPTTLNHYLASPNKLFEALAAGVPVVGPAFPEFEEIVSRNRFGPLGVLCDPRNIKALGAAISSLLAAPPAERVAQRARCWEAARSQWTWEGEAATLIAMYSELTAARELVARQGVVA
jgi:glycosyltransferase involved in cell wall biosynthesis